MRLLSAFLLLVYSIPLLAGNNAPSAEDLEQLKQQISRAQRQLQQAEGQKDELSRDLRKTEVELAGLEKNIYRLTDRINQQQRQLDSLETEQKKLELQKKQQENIISEQILTSYRMGREENIKLLLNQEQPEKFSRALTYADYFNRARVQALQQYQQTLTAIAENTAALEQQTASLLASKEQLLARKRQLGKAHRQREQALAALTDSIQSDQQQLERLQREQSQLEALLRSVNEAVANIRLPSDAIAFSQRRGELSLPAQGQYRNRFGSKRPPGSLTWDGITIEAPAGREVHAVHHGRVVFADWFRGRGLLLILDHGDGYMTLYAHNQTLLRETGDWVSAGETIATVGNSGGLTQTQLYFEIRYQGKPLNPAPWFRRG